MRNVRAPWGRLIAVVAVAGLLVAGCADDQEAADQEAADQEPEVEQTDEATDGDPPAAEPVTVTAVDYAYPDAPDTVAAGTQVTLQNDSEAEVHEILAFRVADDEDRPVEELVQLPPDELMEVVEMRGVALAPPGGSSAESPTPPLVLQQPGRYVFACFIPTGAPPEEVLEAVREFAESGATEGEPDYPQTGPPHIANGMFAEVDVTGG